MSFREDIIKSLGEFPEKTELNLEVLNSEDRQTHVLKKILYNVEKDERITAYLLLPKNLKEKNPAIVASHQHAGEYYLGKSEPAGLSKNSMYHYGLDMCLRGYVVICPDHLCFEDRRPLEYVRKENSMLEGVNYEKFIYTKLISEGKTLQGKYLSDLTKAVDVLETLDFVDGDRIGAIGHSLGGQETLWLAWYEKRIKAAVSSCGFSQLKSILREGINHNLAMYTFGFLSHGDIANLVEDMAPKPFMMTNGDEDSIFPLDGVREIAFMAKEEYDKYNAVDNFESIIFEGGHSFPSDVKSEAYKFLDLHLKG